MTQTKKELKNKFFSYFSNIKILSLFSGAGGLDLGFKKAGFKIASANDNDKRVEKTYNNNFDINITINDIRKIDINTLPISDGIIGGPPCQSWSIAGSRKGVEDDRGKLFFYYIDIIRELKPKFFLAENVSGLLHKRNKTVFSDIIKNFNDIGYKVFYDTLNAKDYNVPQDRKRVFLVGFLNHNINFVFPEKRKQINLKESIFDLRKNAIEFNKEKRNDFNHEYYNGGYSSIYMSRNRVRSWDEPSFTIQAGGRHAPIHPNAPKMEFIAKDKRIFKPNHEHLYRRLSVRECARIQTFPDNFKFIYNNIMDGYKMIGNAVPVNLAQAIALQIKKCL